MLQWPKINFKWAVFWGSSKYFTGTWKKVTEMESKCVNRHEMLTLRPIWSQFHPKVTVLFTVYSWSFQSLANLENLTSFNTIHSRSVVTKMHPIGHLLELVIIYSGLLSKFTSFAKQHDRCRGCSARLNLHFWLSGFTNQYDCVVCTFQSESWFANHWRPVEIPVRVRRTDWFSRFSVPSGRSGNCHRLEYFGSYFVHHLVRGQPDLDRDQLQCVQCCLHVHWPGRRRILSGSLSNSTASPYNFVIPLCVRC